MPALSQEDSAAHNAGLLHAAWEGEVARRGGREASFFGAAHGAFGRYFWASAGYKLVNDVFIFVNPALINVIVGYINGDASQASSRVVLGQISARSRVDLGQI